MTLSPPDYDEVVRIIDNALAEDIGSGDVTSQLLIPPQLQAHMLFVAREGLIACGTFIPVMVYERLGIEMQVEVYCAEGDPVGKGRPLLKISGQAQAILTGERVALNLMQRMSGIARLAHDYSEAVLGTGAVILDTRKTMPGLRALDKYAVRAAGGQNHRMGLYDMVMIKDNHIALCGGIAQAVQTARSGTQLPIVVECDTLAQVEDVLKNLPQAQWPQRILLDNMDTDTLKKAVALVNKRIPLEASGNVSLATVRAVAETGVDYISIGRLTHSAIAADIGADIEIIR